MRTQQPSQHRNRHQQERVTKMRIANPKPAQPGLAPKIVSGIEEKPPRCVPQENRIHDEALNAGSAMTKLK
jgi:hypothetical protein